MNNTQHTAGPWGIDYEQGKNPFVFAAQGKKWGNTVICVLYEDVTPECSVTTGKWLKAQDNASANARLIAAAPDLLACLIDAVRALEFAAPIIEVPEKCSYRETIAEAHAAIAKATGGAK